MSLWAPQNLTIDFYIISVYNVLPSVASGRLSCSAFNSHFGDRSFEFRQGIWLSGRAVAQLVEALRYKPERRGFDSWWCYWNFSLTYSFRSHYGPGVDSASNRNEYQEYFLGGKGGRCVGLTTLPPSCADCLKTWEPRPPGALRACQGL
jgi:hypothetical protein